MKLIFSILILFAVGTAWADAPMKVVYQKSSSAGFSWYWPYKTWHKTTSTETHATGLGSGYFEKVYRPTYDDLSKYRYNNPQRTYLNQWGYYFPAGTRPIRVGTGSAFLTPSGTVYQYRSIP